MLGLLVQFGVLWFLINYFTRETDPDAGYRKAFTIILIVLAANFIMAFTIRPILGVWTSLISLAVLYFAVAWICDTRPRQSLWIVGGFFVTMVCIELVTALIMMPVQAAP